MFYTFFIFALGIFVGQEYNVPSVKNFTQNIITNYIKKEQTQVEREDFPTKMELISSWFFGLMSPKTSPEKKE